MAAQSTGQSDLAKRYATAVFDLALERDQLDRTAEELANLRSLMAESADLSRLVKSPILSRADQGAAMAAIITRVDDRCIVASLLRSRKTGKIPGRAEKADQEEISDCLITGPGRGLAAAPACIQSYSWVASTGVLANHRASRLARPGRFNNPSPKGI